MALYPGFALRQNVTADTVIGTSGLPTVIYSITVQSGTTAQITIRNGPAVTDTIVWGPTVAYTPAATVPAMHFAFPNGLFCPLGGYADVAGTSPVIDITYNQSPFFGN